MPFFTIATAGHVDHGKTSLIKSITNIDTDTLKQEKERGLTIDLGFAYSNFKDKIINFIDVPGHKDFLKNMLAGISTVNTVLLVISANEGIMPQTKEHLDIIKLLGIENIIVIVSKIDLVQINERNRLKDEIDKYFNDLNLNYLKILYFSIHDNNSKNEVMKVLDNLSHKNNTEKEESFILPIDRVFTKKGIGTIVTGTIFSGSLSNQDYLYIEDEKFKIKNIQFNNENVTNTSNNQRISLNININKGNIKRGDILSNTNLINLNTFDISLNTINKINNNDKIKFYYLTREVNGRINLLNKKSVESNAKYFAKITLDEKIIIKKNMKYIIRLQSPEIILGGGKVLSFHNPQKKINIEKRLFLLELLDKKDYKEAFYYLITKIYNIFSIDDLSYYLEKDFLNNILNNNPNIIKIDKYDFIHLDKFLYYKKEVLDNLKSFKEQKLDKIGLDKNTIINEIKIKNNLFDKIIELSLNKEIDTYNNLFFIKADKYEFTSNELKILNILSDFNFQTIKDLSQNLNINESQIKNTINSLKFKNQIITISEQVICNIETFSKILDDIKSFIGNNKKTTSEIREYINLSRKYTIPILEYLDKNKITKRENDLRFLIF